METFEIFPWDKNFEMGIELIDEQHKQLVSILNRLAAHLANRSAPIVLNEIFDELADYASYHFKSEEKIWNKYLKGDEWLTSHETTHQSFINKVISLKSDESGKELDDVIQEVVLFLSKWLAYHILDTDKRMALTIMNIQSGISIKQAKIDSDNIMNGSMRVLIDTVLSMYDSLSLRTLELMREKSLRKQAEEALFQSEEKWKFILEGGADGVWDWSVQHNEHSDAKNADAKNDFISFEIVNNKLCENKDSSKIHPADKERVKQQIQAHLDGETELYVNKYRMLHDNGSWSWILSRGKVVSFDDQGNALRMVGANSDITERELATLIYQHSSQAMLVTDINNTIISINPAFTKITGYSELESLGRNPSFLGSSKNNKQFYKEMWNDLNTSGFWTNEICNKQKNNELYFGSLEINAITNPNGQVDHYIGLFSETTEKKNAEALILRKTKELEETNTTLRIILSQQKNLEEDLQQNILNQLEKSIFPYVDLLAKNLTEKRNQEFLSILSQHLKTIGESFIQRLANPNIGLTKKEILVADLVKQGKNSKQIALLLNLETRSVEAYRNKIRKKLSINNKKISLIEYLNSYFSS